MNVLFVVSECVPFIKSGGLADVAGALPKELQSLDTEVRVILPKYSLIAEEYRNQMEKVAAFEVHVGWRRQYCAIEKLVHDGITYYFIDNEYYFKRDSLYGHYDDGERFSFFCRAVLDSIPYLEFKPDVLHCHDWHSGMVSFLLNAQYRQYEIYSSIRTVFTIHNLQFQGIFPKNILGDLLNLEDSYFTIDQLEFYGCISFMKGAIVSSDRITTVSPTYKNEIMMPYFGEKLDGLLRYRQKILMGILNGIDDDIYNPEKDPHIQSRYSNESIGNKVENKVYIQRYFSLPVKKETPIIAIISRLTAQKGLELVTRVFNELMQNDVQFIILGTGEEQFEQFFQQMARIYPDKVAVLTGFDEKLAHQIYAGADLFLMPSKFEPCGLGQLIALRYGTIPIVRETGGLNDTVQSYNELTGEGNGFSFKNYNAHDMLFTIERAIAYYNQKEHWLKLINEAMGRDYSWSQSAQKYDEIYKELK